ncbi:MAG: TonB-dependent receptor [Methylobacter sp.]|nr:MAG: TonB-dependent receptor [Methylobacter sp.]
MRKQTIIAILAVLSGQVNAKHSSVDEDLTNLSIEELLNVEVISAPRLGQQTNKSPSSVSVLNASDIRTFGWRTLADALNGMRGLFTANNRNYSFLGVRGFIQPNDYNSRVLVMIDGMRMNENIYDTGNIAQEFMLDTDLIERIEFIPGSGSTIYGANAFLGLINVVTKSGKAIKGAQVAGDAGSFDTYKGRASYGKKLENGADMLFSASHFESAGAGNLFFPAYDNPATNNGVAHNMDAERADRLFGKIQFQGLTVSGGVVDRFKRVPAAVSGDIFNDPGNYTDDRQFFGNVKYNKAINEKTTALFQGFFQGYDYHAEEPYLFGQTAQRRVFHDATVGRWLGGDAQLTTRAFDRQRLMLGLEYQYDIRQHQFSYDVAPYTLYADNNLNGHRVEVYAQDDIQLSDSLLLSAGLRFDYHHMIKALPLNPRLGLIWNPLASTTLKLLYSSTFRAPNAAELAYNPYYFDISPPIAEEQIQSYESIMEWNSPDGLKLFGSLFFNDISRFLQVSPDTGLLENTGQFHIYGTELEAEKRWGSGRLLKISYTYNFVSDQTNQGTRVYGAPEHLIKLHYAEPLFNNFARLGVESIFIGDRKTQQGGLVDAYDLVNVNLTSDRLVQGLDLSASIYNLLDDHYQVVGDGVNNILLMNGREFRFKFVLTY